MTPKAELSASLTAILLPHLRASGRYHLPGFGVWTLKTRPARRIRNPVTKLLMWLPASIEVRFHAAKRLRKAAGRLTERRSTPEATQGAAR